MVVVVLGIQFIICSIIYWYYWKSGIRTVDTSHEWVEVFIVIIFIATFMLSWTSILCGCMALFSFVKFGLVSDIKPTKRLQE